MSKCLKYCKNWWKIWNFRKIWKLIFFVSLAIFPCKTEQNPTITSKNALFRLIFHVILSIQVSLLQLIHLRQMRSGKRYLQNSFWAPWRPLRPHLTLSDIYFYFIPSIPPPHEAKNHLLNLIPTKIHQILEIGLEWRRIWYSREE